MSLPPHKFVRPSCYYSSQEIKNTTEVEQPPVAQRSHQMWNRHTPALDAVAGRRESNLGLAGCATPAHSDESRTTQWNALLTVDLAVAAHLCTNLRPLGSSHFLWQPWCDLLNPDCARHMISQPFIHRSWISKHSNTSQNKMDLNEVLSETKATTIITLQRVSQPINAKRWYCGCKEIVVQHNSGWTCSIWLIISNSSAVESTYTHQQTNNQFPRFLLRWHTMAITKYRFILLKFFLHF
jgi:hypothetical protein